MMGKLVTTLTKAHELSMDNPQAQEEIEEALMIVRNLREMFTLMVALQDEAGAELGLGWSVSDFSKLHPYME